MLAIPPGPVHVITKFKENCSGSMRAAPSVGFEPDHPSDASHDVAFCEIHVIAVEPPTGASVGKSDMLTDTGAANESNIGVEDASVEDALNTALVDDEMNGIAGKPSVSGGGTTDMRSSGNVFNNARVFGPTVPTPGNPRSSWNVISAVRVRMPK